MIGNSLVFMRNLHVIASLFVESYWVLLGFFNFSWCVILLFDHEKYLQDYKAQSPLQNRTQFSGTTVESSTVERTTVC